MAYIVVYVKLCFDIKKVMRAEVVSCLLNQKGSKQCH